MESRETLHAQIRAMATECAICDRDARDAELEHGVTLDLSEIAHPEDAFDTDLLWHRRERHREKLRKRIEAWIAAGKGHGG
ncbi:MAG TPA: hypothetical protein VMH37_18425 [Candidatus Binataceae bacterium]|nr:hypothetical protein [Candidatus Binataceae bacterium]